MADFTPEPFEQWSQDEQDLWTGMVDSSGHSELMEDDDLMNFYDIAFNTPKGEIEADDRHAIMRALFDYIQETYDFDFKEQFNWAAWREMMGY